MQIYSVLSLISFTLSVRQDTNGLTIETQSASLIES